MIFGRSIAAPSAEIGIRLWRLPPFRDSCQDATIAKAISIPTTTLADHPVRSSQIWNFRAQSRCQSNELNIIE